MINLDPSITRGDWWGIREYKERYQYRMGRNGKSSEHTTFKTHGVMVEVMINGHVGYAATDNLSNRSLKLAFEKAESAAKLTAKYPLFKFANWETEVRPKQVGHYQTKVALSLAELTPEVLSDFLIKSSKHLKNGPNILDSMAMLMLFNTKVSYMTSNGSSWTQSYSSVVKDFSVTASKDGIIQKRTLGMMGNQGGAEAIFNFDIKGTSNKILKEVNDLLVAPECPSEKMDIILHPDQLYLQVHESIGHPLELDRILGDERNYAGWSFIEPDDFGKLRYGPDILNVTFDPTIPNELASCAFDDTGVPARKEYLIKDGVLVAGIGGAESQQRSGLNGVSCMRATSWNRPPMDRMGNINIEPGTSTVEEMIKSTERGIFMETNKSWSIDDYRNKFQFGCEYARLIEDGELKGVVKNPNYRGATVNFWNGLTHVGNPESFKVWGSPYCGKGEPNQVIHVGHAIPTCKFTNIDVFGGA